MKQETGETRDAIMEDVQKQIDAIISANKHRNSIYWIVLFAKPFRQQVDGKPTLIQHVKPYATKPKGQVGMIVASVDNSSGKINWEINMPQKPFDFDKLQIYGAKRCDEVITESTTITGAYITQ